MSAEQSLNVSTSPLETKKIGLGERMDGVFAKLRSQVTGVIETAKRYVTKPEAIKVEEDKVATENTTTDALEVSQPQVEKEVVIAETIQEPVRDPRLKVDPKMEQEIRSIVRDRVQSSSVGIETAIGQIRANMAVQAGKTEAYKAKVAKQLEVFKLDYLKLQQIPEAKLTEKNKDYKKFFFDEIQKQQLQLDTWPSVADQQAHQRNLSDLDNKITSISPTASLRGVVSDSKYRDFLKELGYIEEVNEVETLYDQVLANKEAGKQALMGEGTDNPLVSEFLEISKQNIAKKLEEEEPILVTETADKVDTKAEPVPVITESTTKAEKEQTPLQKQIELRKVQLASAALNPTIKKMAEIKLNALLEEQKVIDKEKEKTSLELVPVAVPKLTRKEAQSKLTAWQAQLDSPKLHPAIKQMLQTKLNELKSQVEPPAVSLDAQSKPEFKRLSPKPKTFLEKIRNTGIEQGLRATNALAQLRKGIGESKIMKSLPKPVAEFMKRNPGATVRLAFLGISIAAFLTGESSNLAHGQLFAGYENNTNSSELENISFGRVDTFDTLTSGDLPSVDAFSTGDFGSADKHSLGALEQIATASKPNEIIETQTFAPPLSVDTVSRSTNPVETLLDRTDSSANHAASQFAMEDKLSKANQLPEPTSIDTTESTRDHTASQFAAEAKVNTMREPELIDTTETTRDHAASQFAAEAKDSQTVAPITSPADQARAIPMSTTPTPAGGFSAEQIDQTQARPVQTDTNTFSTEQLDQASSRPQANQISAESIQDTNQAETVVQYTPAVESVSFVDQATEFYNQIIANGQKGIQMTPSEYEKFNNLFQQSSITTGESRWALIDQVTGNIIKMMP